MQILIDPALKELVPRVSLGVLTYEVTVEKSSAALQATFEQAVQAHKIELAEITKLPAIQDTRKAYKSLGKAPASYRNAAEAMLRRIAKGNGLYQINNVVDLNNLLSISTGFSIGSYDVSALVGPVQLKRAVAGETYRGIGKEELKVEFLPTLYDERGAFGNPTSDSRRAMVQNGRQTVMSVVYSFSGKSELAQLLQHYQEQLQTYTDADAVTAQII